MTLLQRIEEDRDGVRRVGNSEDTAFYSYLIAKAREPGKSDKPPRESTDDEVVAVIRKLMRENDETLAVGHGQGEERLRKQNKLLQVYLPEQLSPERLREIIIAVIEGSGQPKSKRLIGVVMNHLKAEYGNQFAPGIASQIANEIINS